MKKNMCSKKGALVEKLGVHIETNNGYSPIASRVLAYIILTGKIGTTFEDLVQLLCASKSTISTQLNYLSDIKEIEYFTKTGDRKKYYVITSNKIKSHISNMIQKWEVERELHEEVRDYKKEINDLENTQENEKFDLTFHNNYIQFLNQAITSISKLNVDNINL
ncbi:GbsR/MarR family transcriptional regulator [Cellulophaga omnivescoria]|uniref:GbsR/MarR family transcriptional regulator n=1 Tax=Cellulophaga omnivescoria TaxID=1888890 RepID=UPI0009877513|nr:transcriptional regulator [Cellulophaga omnivescoria]WBU88522.1 transcriptional regulator [Cellulophaga omnivescoria]WKB80501.1 transcriptional regulator [Cellulophaga lytica]